MVLRRKLDSGRLLKSKRLVLSPLQYDDFEKWSEVRTTNRRWLVPWEPTRMNQSLDPDVDQKSFRNRCEMWRRESSNGRAYQFGIFLKESLEEQDFSPSNVQHGDFIGEVNITAIYRGVSQSCALGYWMDERHAGNSYMPEAVVAACNFAFEGLQLHRVQIAIVPRNAPSLRVVEKLGLRKEGLSERYLEINGNWEDHYIFAITFEEWLERKEEFVKAWLSDGSNSESYI